MYGRLLFVLWERIYKGTAWSDQRKNKKKFKKSIFLLLFCCSRYDILSTEKDKNKDIHQNKMTKRYERRTTMNYTADPNRTRPHFETGTFDAETSAVFFL